MIFIVYIMYIVYSPYLRCIIYTCHVRFMCIHMFYIPAISHTVRVYIYIHIYMQVFGHLDLSRSLVMRSSRQFELARVP